MFALTWPLATSLATLYAAKKGAVTGFIANIGENGVTTSLMPLIVSWTKLPEEPGVHEYKLVKSDIGATFPFASAVNVSVSVPPRVLFPETKVHVPSACG